MMTRPPSSSAGYPSSFVPDGVPEDLPEEKVDETVTQSGTETSNRVVAWLTGLFRKKEFEPEPTNHEREIEGKIERYRALKTAAAAVIRKRDTLKEQHDRAVQFRNTELVTKLQAEHKSITKNADALKNQLSLLKQEIEELRADRDLQISMMSFDPEFEALDTVREHISRKLDEANGYTSNLPAVTNDDTDSSL